MPIAESVRSLTIGFGRDEYGGERDIPLLPCRLRSLGDLPAYLWTTTNVHGGSEAPGVVAVITSLGLRDTYGLIDGQIVEVPIDTEPLR